MKAYVKVIFLTAVLVFFAVGCSLEFTPSKSQGSFEALLYMPPDIVNDQAREAVEGEFDFKTLVPVGFRITVDAYDLRSATNEEQARSIAPLARELGEESVDIIVVLTTTEKKTIYLGHINSQETLEFEAILPIASRDLLLTIIADGFEPRTIVISDPADYETIDRELSLGMTKSTEKLIKLLDMDKDLIPDRYDAFPTDEGRAFVIQVPLDGPATIAFEDLYPVPGDSDYNDFNAVYSVEEVYTPEGERIEISGKVKARARAAGYDHRFGIRVFLGEVRMDDEPIPVDGLLEVSYFDEEMEPIGGFSEAVSGTADITVFEHTKQAFWRPTSYVTVDNGYKDRLDSKGFTTEFTITLNTKIRPIFDKKDERARYALPPYDPYLYVYNAWPHRDIHLIDMPKLEDSDNLPTDPPDFRYDEGGQVGFPWAMLLAIDWPYPVEGQDIHEAYPEFAGWYGSGGLDNTEWYLKPVEELVISPEVPEPPVTIDELYIETFSPDGVIFGTIVDTRVRLYSGDGVWGVESSNPGTGFDDLEYTGGLEPDVYYIEVTGVSGSAGGDYGVRALATTRDAAPSTPEPGSIGDSGDVDGIPEPWNGGSSTPISLGESGYVIRALSSGDDSDWFLLDLR